MKFVHLHNHSYFSIQDAVESPTDLALAARKKGFSAIALTDHGKMGGIVEFVEACRSEYENYPPIKPIIGLEAYICQNRHIKDEESNKTFNKRYHITLLAMNEIGYSNLIMLSTLSFEEGFYYYPRIDWELLEKYNEGIIVLSGCIGSEINQLILNDEIDKVKQIISKYKDLFNDRYYLEVQYHGLSKQKKVALKLKDLAKEFNIKLVGTNDVHYIDKEDYIIHEALLKTKTICKQKTDDNISIDNWTYPYETNEYYLKTYEEMLYTLGNYVELLNNTCEIAEKIEDYFKINVKQLLPNAQLNINDEFLEWKKNNLPYHKENEAYLAYKALKGLDKLGLINNPVYVKRLKYEIESIWYMGVVDYFLIQLEIVEFMQKNNILYGIRGSGVSSLVNYALGICLIDPVKWDLLFERFLNPGRGNQYKIDFEVYPVSKWIKENKDDTKENYYKQMINALIKKFIMDDNYKEIVHKLKKELWVLQNQNLNGYIGYLLENNIKSDTNDSQLWIAYLLGITNEKPTQPDLIVTKAATLPDIDTDIEDTKRELVIQWVKERFGEDCVVQVSTKNKFRLKNAIQNCLKISNKFRATYGNDVAKEAIKISKLIPQHLQNETLDYIIENVPDFQKYYYKHKNEIELAKKLMGIISSEGIHASAILIASKPVRQIIPLQLITKCIASAFDMEAVEKVGLVKYDFLGSATFTAISEVIKIIKNRYNIDIKLTDIPLDDPKVFSIYNNKLTSTIFQAASTGMTEALCNIKVNSIEDIIVAIAMYRPGPLQYINVYANNKFNPQKINYKHPLIEKYLSKTYGVMVYQEQAMFLAREMAKLSWNEVDKLRKGIAKKQSAGFIESCKLFEKKALENNIPINAIKEVLHLMEKFGGYAFNKAHATAYAIESYWTAYFRYYYPVEWFAAMLQIECDNKNSANAKEQIALYKKECNLCGIKVLPPNINESKLTVQIIDNNTLLMPLIVINGINEQAAIIVENQPYTSLIDLLNRTNVTRATIKALIEEQALNCLPDVEQFKNQKEQIYAYYEEIINNKKKNNKKNKTQVVVENNLFNDYTIPYINDAFNLNKQKNNK